MPTEAVTGTEHMRTTGGAMPDKKPAKKAEATKKAAAKPETVDPQQGHFRRRNWTDDNGVQVIEEQRPGSKAWVRVD